ncbi:MAG: TIGR03668 family PPOX class F420-dependent oxidoreductase [Actinomycetota bacterium]
MDEAEARRRLLAEPFVVLATHGPEGRIDLVPCCVAELAAADDGRLVSVVDHKPKRHQRLARLRNIEADGAVTLLADGRSDDWSRLWWVRVHATASVVDDGPLHAAAVDALVAGYAQYRHRRPDGPAIVIEPERWTGWAATPLDGS